MVTTISTHTLRHHIQGFYPQNVHDILPTHCEYYQLSSHCEYHQDYNSALALLVKSLRCSTILSPWSKRSSLHITSPFRVVHNRVSLVCLIGFAASNRTHNHPRPTPANQEHQQKQELRPPGRKQPARHRPQANDKQPCIVALTFLPVKKNRGRNIKTTRTINVHIWEHTLHNIQHLSSHQQ